MANREIVININQCLHGYQNGHQLLASSVNLELSAKRTLLYQSDLSGSMSLGFETYISGYPIIESNLYVLARTWYAPEMDRPGCVWTHSLVLEYSDIGKLPDLSILNKLFKRPQKDKYDEYQFPISFDSLQFIVTAPKKRKFKLTDKMRVIMDGLYNYPESTCIIPQNNSKELEEDILKIWSEQWPRLRRGFTFCTGSLGLRVLDSVEYDLQVVPEKIMSGISRQSKKNIIVDFENIPPNDWLGIFESYDQQSIHKFLWTFGADIDGIRKNYVPLISLYGSIHSEKFSLHDLYLNISTYFPDADKAKSIKRNLFGGNSILPVKEKELVQFLLSNNNNIIKYDDLQIVQRFANLVSNNELTQDEFVDLFKKFLPFDLDNSFWGKANLSFEYLLQLLKKYPSLALNNIVKYPEFAIRDEIWKLDYSVQKEIIRILSSTEIDWQKVIESVIKSKSSVIFDLRRVLKEPVTFYSLDLINKGFIDILNKEWVMFLIHNDNLFSDWIYNNRNNLAKPIFILIFEYMSPSQIESLRLETIHLIRGLDIARKDSGRNFVNLSYSKLLAIGINNILIPSYPLVEQTFSLVYAEIRANRIDNRVWKYIKRGYPFLETGNSDLLSSFFSFFGKRKNKKFVVENSDIGRQLIVKVVNTFFEKKWPLKSFVSIFSKKPEFYEALVYCGTFQQGIFFVDNLIHNVLNGAIKLNSDQQFIIKKLQR